MITYITNATIYTPKETIKNGYLKIIDSKIREINRVPKPSEIEVDATIIDAKTNHVIPGFIDTHIHGTNGADVMDALPSSLDHIALSLPEEGTTSFLATTLTHREEKIEAALENVSRYQKEPGHARLLGVHLEGPFLNRDKPGAQPQAYMQKPNIALFQKWQKASGNNIRLVSLAPELDDDVSFIKTLHQQGILVSAGHTTANLQQATLAIEQGLSRLTHAGNGMPALHHRDVGILGAAILNSDIQIEIIADGVHLSKEMIQILYQLIGPDRIVLITNGIRAKGLAPGKFDLAGQEIFVKDNIARRKDGALAGSVLPMNKAAKIMQQFTNASMHDLIKMTATNPARSLCINDFTGSIEVDKEADIIIVNNEWEIKHTFVRGLRTKRNEEEENPKHS